MLKDILAAIVEKGDIRACLQLIDWLRENDDYRELVVSQEVGRTVRRAAVIRTSRLDDRDHSVYWANRERKQALSELKMTLTELFWQELTDNPIALISGAAEELKLVPEPDPNPDTYGPPFNPSTAPEPAEYYPSTVFFDHS